MTMTPKRPNRTTIIVEPAIRDSLKHIARKDQSYNALLIDLIKLHQDHIEKTVQKGSARPTDSPANPEQTQQTQQFKAIEVIEEAKTL